jgi:PEP-CTERM motif
MRRHRPISKLIWLLAGAFFLLRLPCLAASLPGVGNGDLFCAPQAGGPTLCIVNEGQGDSLVELVINGTNVNILINNITAGPINALGPDLTDTITSDPIGANPFGLMPPAPFCIGAILVPGASCFFTQSFTTNTPGDPDDNANIPLHGEATMFFNLTFTPQGVVVGPAPANNAQNIGVAGHGALPPNPDGSFTAQIESADVKINDVVPEPSTLLLLGGGVGLMLCAKVIRDLAKNI